MVTIYIGIVALIMGVIFSEPLKRLIWKGFNERTENERKIYQLVESSKDIIYYCEIKPELKYRYLSPAIDEILRPNLVKDSMKNPYTAFEIIHPDDYHILEKKIKGELDFNKPIILRWKDQHGQYKWFEEYATPIYLNGEFVAIHGIIRNIDEIIKLQKQLEYKIEHDPLTGIYNREFFERQMELLNQRIDSSVGIILCDLDELKWMNDNHGHKMGDQLIIKTAEFLEEYAKEDIFVIRIGGDEFAILLINTDQTKVYNFSKSLGQAVASYNSEHPDFKIKLSIGFGYESSSIGNMEKLFNTADKNMYQNKNIRKPIESKN